MHLYKYFFRRDSKKWNCWVEEHCFKILIGTAKSSSKRVSLVFHSCQWRKMGQFLHSCLNWYDPSFSFWVFKWVKTFHCCFDVHFPDYYCCWAYFHMFIAIWDFFFWEFPLQLFCAFFPPTGLFAFFFLRSIFTCSLH